MERRDDDLMPPAWLVWTRELLPLALMFLAGIAWGLKLEARIDAEVVANTEQARGISRLQQQADAGILPVAAERINALNARVARLENGACSKP
jgi:hypothetical protein